MPRVYRVTGNPSAVANAANTELLQGLATSTGKFIVTRLEIGQLTTEVLTGIVVQISRFTGGFTPGSGGTARTPAKIDTNDAAAISTWLELNTTAITAGTATTLAFHTMQDVVGMQEIPLPDDGLQFNLSEALQVKIVTALGASTNLTYVVTIREI